ncbi:UNVERIFIED_CONTAM: hypothetical protein Scaly_0319000, partial [Sesamum calycinum]
ERDRDRERGGGKWRLILGFCSDGFGSEAIVGVGFDKGIPEGNDFGASMKKIVCADCFQERSDLPLESPEPVEFFSINHCFFPSSALKLDDDDDLPEALDTGRFPVSVTTRRILNFMKLVGQYLQLVRGPTWLSPSSVEADITGGSNMSSQVQPKQEASTASSKNYTFRKGDRVKYVGSLPSGFSPTQTPKVSNESTLVHFSEISSNPNYIVAYIMDEGPTYGYRGKVVLAFEENGSSKIGVRFDRAIPEGNDLGGLCEEDHGFFCAADLLRLDSSSADDIEKLAINELFEVASEESKSAPLILFLKDREKCLVGNPEAYAAFKIKLETLPENVDVIASHTQTDSRKEKSHPGGLLFTKFGSNQTALLDLAFPLRLVEKVLECNLCEHFMRVSCCYSSLSYWIILVGCMIEVKNSKNNEAAQPPFPKQSNHTDSPVLVDWKQKLDRDTETLKSQSNIGSIRSVLKRLLAGVYAITLCIPPELHPRSGNALFEVKDCFQERSDLPLESPEPVEFFSINHCFFPSSALKLDDDDDLPEALDTGRFPVSVTTRRILNFMKLVGQYLQLVRGPTWLSPSSVEADITGGSNMSSQVQPKQEASRFIQKYTFRKGDRVKYVGSLPSGFSPTQTPIRCLMSPP